MDQSAYAAASAGRGMPYDSDAEAALLCAMISDEDARVTSVAALAADDFYVAAHRAVFEAVAYLVETAAPVDVVTIKNVLDSKGVFDTIGGMQTLAAIATAISTSANAERYAKIVADKSVLRRLIDSANKTLEECYGAVESVDDCLAAAQGRVYDISMERRAKDFTHIREALSDSLDSIEKAFKGGEPVTGVPTGYRDLDRKTAGLHPSDLVLIAARPSMGKTALGLNIAQYAAVKKNVPVALFSLEMSKEQLATRLLASEAMVDANYLRTGDFGAEPDKVWEKVIYAIGPLGEAPLYLDDTPSITPPQIRAKLQKLQMQKGLGLVVIDYLQLMSGSGRRNENRQQEISEISRSLKAIARDLSVPIVALAQLSRAPETRSDHRPILSDLRESGAIEQDADLVAFIYRDEYYNPDTEKRGVAEIIIAKQRNGETGVVDLGYINKYVKFVELEK